MFLPRPHPLAQTNIPGTYLNGDGAEPNQNATSPADKTATTGVL